MEYASEAFGGKSEFLSSFLFEDMFEKSIEAQTPMFVLGTLIYYKDR